MKTNAATGRSEAVSPEAWRAWRCFASDSGPALPFLLRWWSKHQRASEADQDRVCIRVSSCGEPVWEQHPDEQNKLRTNGEKVFEIAKQMASDPNVLWAQENEPF